jgi:hypothetical protein
MRQFYGSAAVIAVCALSACVSVDYMGRSYAPTEHVDVHYAMDQVRRPYEVMGRAEARADSGVEMRKFEEELVKEARKRGADAIVIEDSALVVSGENTSTSGTTFPREPGKKKKKWYEPDYVEESTTTVTHERIIITRFLKYTGQ